jgi:hypothetical protein
MRTFFRSTFAATVLAFTFTAGMSAASAQMQMAPSKGKAPLSPPAMAETTLGGKKVTIKYAAPSIRGRVIMGGLVPYGEVWRTGANAATSLTTETALKIGTLTVPAGSYTLYTLPAAPGTPWMLIINKQTGQWGTVYQKDQDLGRTELKSARLPAAQEVMSISFDKVSGKKAELHIKWETTDEFVAVSAE